MTRRSLFASLPALAAVPKMMAQSSKPQFPVKFLSHMTLSVSDPKRSLEFYQGLFGLPVQAYQGKTPVLRIGAGPQFLFLGLRVSIAGRTAQGNEFGAVSMVSHHMLFCGIHKNIRQGS